MAPLMPHRRPRRLERSCDDWIRAAPAAPGLARVEVRFARGGFAPHRHDDYVVGVTVAGVQEFRYRGVAERCLAGELFVLHPDERHDGHAGTDDGFRYRTLYVEPRLIADALGGARSLPFARRAVSNDGALAAAIAPAFEDLESPLEPLQRDQLVLELADALAAADRSRPPVPCVTVDSRAIARAREFLDARIRRGAGSAELEMVAGLSRWELSRQFRAALGTSPHRYLVLRRLDRARALIRGGVTLAETASATGFADQSHLTRHFLRAYGVTPGRWSTLSAA